MVLNKKYNNFFFELFLSLFFLKNYKKLLKLNKKQLIYKYTVVVNIYKLKYKINYH